MPQSIRFFILLFTVTCLLFTPVLPIHAQTSWTLDSPNHLLSTTINLHSGQLNLTASINSSPCLTLNQLGLQASSPLNDLTTNLSFVNSTVSSVQYTYTATYGKRRLVNDLGRTLQLTLVNPTTPQTLEFHLQVFNDGLAYRYSLPGSGSSAVAHEPTQFSFPESTTFWAADYASNYEQLYTARSSTTTADWSLPLLAQNPTCWQLITEAHTTASYTSSRLVGLSNNQLQLKAVPDQPLPVPIQLPFTSPWRVILLGSTPQPLLESTLVSSLNPPPSGDFSWVKPGRVAWSWLTDHQSPANFERQKQYVDFATSMGWEYILVDEGWSDSWVPSLVAYAQTKGVKVILWFFWGNWTQWTPTGWVVDETSARRQFTRLQNWGVAGAKIDFMGSENQERLAFYDLINRLSAEYHILVNFHGANKSTGEQRTYPSVATREGVQGGEHQSQTASGNLPLVFTRNVVGSMDFTPITFTSPGTTTAAHQLSEAVLFESGLQHFADSLEAYTAQPASALLKTVPTVWDDTRYLAGTPDTYVALARRQNQRWYVGIMSIASRSLSLPLNSFLEPGTYTLTSYTDSATPTTITITQTTITSPNTYSVNLHPEGGAVLVFDPVSLLPTPIPGDFNGNGFVDYPDLLQLIHAFSTPNPLYNFTGNSLISLFDFNHFLHLLGQ